MDRHFNEDAVMQAPTNPVYGHVIAPPRFTRMALKIAMTRIALPFLLLLLGLDLILWAVMRGIFDACYGILCLL